MGVLASAAAIMSQWGMIIFILALAAFFGTQYLIRRQRHREACWAGLTSLVMNGILALLNLVFAIGTGAVGSLLIGALWCYFTYRSWTLLNQLGFWDRFRRR